MENKPRKKPILSYIIAFLLLLVEGITVYIIHSANLLPGKYFILLCAVIVIFTVFIFLLLFIPGKNKNKPIGTGRMIIAYILILSCYISCLMVAKVFITINDTFSGVTENSSILSYYGIYVLNDDPAHSLEETEGYVYGVSSSFAEEDNELCLSEVQQSAGVTISVNPYSTPYELIDALYSGDAQAIILDNAYIDILTEIDQYSDFSERARSIFEREIESELESKPPVEAEPEQELKSPTETPFIIYLSGTDVRYNVNSRSRSDVNILAVVNPLTHQILLVNTPRDYYIPNPAGDGALDKLTHLGLYGVDCSAQGLSDLYGLPIQYTARINFSGFEKLIDAIGGVTIRPEVTDETYGWREEITFDGYSALEFARERGYSGGDRTRGNHQMELVRGLADKLMSGAILSNYSDIMESLQGMFITDMPADVISAFIKMQLDEMPHWDIDSYSVTGSDTHQNPYSMPGLISYCMEPDMDTVARGSELMQRVLDGEILSSEDLA